MFRLPVFVILFSVLAFLSMDSWAQTENTHVTHVQTWKLKTTLEGDDAKAFADMMQRQIDAVNTDRRLISYSVVRHSWGADSRDVVVIGEFRSLDDLLSFYDEFDSLLESAFSKEQLEMDDALFNKYLGEHSDEIYAVIAEIN